MTSYENLNASQIAALRQIFEALNACHAPPFAAEFLDEFWLQILVAVAQSKTVP